MTDEATPEIYKQLAAAGIAMAAVLSLGVMGYHVIEGWSLFDSLYMTVITLATVGYGETHELSSHGRVFTIFLIFVGIGILTYAFSTLTAFLVEGELKDVLRRRRMEKKIAQLEGHYILCGAGRTGQTIIEELSKTHRQFVVVERNADRVEALLARGIVALHGDASQDEVLLKAGIEKARGLFTAMPNDQDNVFVTITARGLNPNLRIVSREVESRVAEKLRRSGADIVVNPALIGGLRMASEMIRPAAVGFLDSMIRAEGKVFRIEDIKVPDDSPLKGRPLEAVKGSEGGAALVLAVKHPHHKTYELNPNPSRPIEAGEILVAMGTVEHIKELQQKVAG